MPIFNQSTISDSATLRELYRPPSIKAVKKCLDYLDSHARQFIALSPLLVIATSDGCNCSDVSPRGGAPGHVDIPDDKHLYLPDRPGNNRLDSYHNILRFPFVGMLFFIPGIPETLRVNGRATIQSHADGGRRPGTGLLVEVSEVFLHCSVALELSHCWAPERWPQRGALASASRIWADHIRQSGNG